MEEVAWFLGPPQEARPDALGDFVYTKESSLFVHRSNLGSPSPCRFPTHREPMSLLDLIRPHELSKVARLQLLAKQVVEGYRSGRHRSPHKGFSVEFKEHRQYVRGDELKNIDWQAYAKSDRLFIREYEEETSLRCTLLVDRSGSMRYGGQRTIQANRKNQMKTKYDVAQALAASIGYLMLSQQDSVGAITFDDQPRAQVPSRCRPSHLTALMKALAEDATRRETDLGGVFQKIAPNLGRRGLVVILSDAMGDVDSITQAMAQLRASRHEVLFFQILDPDEMDFPFSGRIQFLDLENESNEQIVDAQSLRKQYIKRYEQHQEELIAGCRRHRVDHVVFQTDHPLVDGLHQYMARRRRVR